MMELRLKYGEKILSAELPEFFVRKNIGKPDRHFIELHAKHIATLQTPAAIINQALDRTLGCYPFNRVFRGARNVLIVVPDPVEVTGAEFYLPLLKARLNELRVPDEEIRLLVATRADALIRQKNFSAPFSELVGEKVRVFRHDPHDHKTLEYAGRTRRGTPVFVNRLLFEAENVLVSGSVVSHPFAGYGGGPRLIVPGCAGAETTHRHFSHALDPETQQAHARCRDATIDGNPLQEDSREAFRFITAGFLLHTILNDQRQIVGAIAGEPLQAFAAGCKAIDSMCGATLATAANLVIVSCGGHPNDVDFRAVYAALQRATQIVRPDGVIIFAAECRDGAGDFLAQQIAAVSSVTQKIPEPQEILNARAGWSQLQSRGLEQNACEALMAPGILQQTREHRIIFVADLPRAFIEQAGFIPATSLSAALTLAERILSPPKPRLAGDIFSAILIFNGTFTVPHLI